MTDENSHFNPLEVSLENEIFDEKIVRELNNASTKNLVLLHCKINLKECDQYSLPHVKFIRFKDCTFESNFPTVNAEVKFENQSGFGQLDLTGSTIEDCWVLNCNCLPKICFSKVKSLDLECVNDSSRLKDLTELRRMKVYDLPEECEFNPTILRFCPNLSELTILGRKPDLDPFFFNDGGFGKLETLRLEKQQRITHHSFHKLSSLRNLDIRDCKGIEPESLLRAIPENIRYHLQVSEDCKLSESHQRWKVNFKKKVLKSIGSINEENSPKFRRMEEISPNLHKGAVVFGNGGPCEECLIRRVPNFQLGFPIRLWKIFGESITNVFFLHVDGDYFSSNCVIDIVTRKCTFSFEDFLKERRMYLSSYAKLDIAMKIAKSLLFIERKGVLHKRLSEGIYIEESDVARKGDRARFKVRIGNLGCLSRIGDVVDIGAERRRDIVDFGGIVRSLFQEDVWYDLLLEEVVKRCVGVDGMHFRDFPEIVRCLENLDAKDLFEHRSKGVIGLGKNTNKIGKELESLEDTNFKNLKENLRSGNEGSTNEVKILGEGSYSVVMKFWYIINSKLRTPVAVKRIIPTSVEEVKKIGKEISLMKELAGIPGICRYYGHYIEYIEKEDEDDYYCVNIVMERYGCNLLLWKRKIEFEGSSNESVLKKKLEILDELLSTLGLLEERGICHGDIKPENILIDGSGKLVVSDFGLSFQCEGVSVARTGTKLFMAPECFYKKKQERNKQDVYSFGMLAFWLLEKGSEDILGSLKLDFFHGDKGIEFHEQGLAPNLDFLKKTDKELAFMVLKCLAPYKRRNISFKDARAIVRDAKKRIQTETFQHGTKETEFVSGGSTRRGQQ